MTLREFHESDELRYLEIEAANTARMCDTRTDEERWEDEDAAERAHWEAQQEAFAAVVLNPFAPPPDVDDDEPPF